MNNCFLFTGNADRDYLLSLILI